MTKVTIDRALIEQAVEALERIDAWFKVRHFVGLVPQEVEIATSLRAALAEPARTSQDVCTVPLLSDEEIAAEAEKHTLSDSEERQWYGDNYTVNVNSPQGAKTFARAIEQLVRRKAGL